MQNISNSDYRERLELAQMNNRFAELGRATMKASEAFENYKASCAMLSKYSFKADRMLDRMRAFANPAKPII